MNHDQSCRTPSCCYFCGHQTGIFRHLDWSCQESELDKCNELSDRVRGIEHFGIKNGDKYTTPQNTTSHFITLHPTKPHRATLHCSTPANTDHTQPHQTEPHLPRIPHQLNPIISTYPWTNFSIRFYSNLAWLLELYGPQINEHFLSTTQNTTDHVEELPLQGWPITTRHLSQYYTPNHSTLALKSEKLN